MAKVIRVYWDACAWIAYINQERSIETASGRFENRYAMCSEVLKMAQEKKLEIATSAFTLAEVCKNPEVKDSPLDNFPAFFEKSYILIVPVDMAICQLAGNADERTGQPKASRCNSFGISAKSLSVCIAHF